MINVNKLKRLKYTGTSTQETFFGKSRRSCLFAEQFRSGLYASGDPLANSFSNSFPHSTEKCRKMLGIFPLFHCN